MNKAGGDHALFFVMVILTLASLEITRGCGTFFGPPQAKQIFILAGQSNMAGRGGTESGLWDQIVPPDDAEDPRILRLNANLEWEMAKDPLHIDIDTGKVNGIGPGMSFANAVKDYVLLSRGGSAIGLVPCAIGGTNITQWARGTKNYERIMTRANVATYGGGEIRAVLWYQGEDNAVPPEEQIQAYKPDMEQFIQDVRTDLNMPCLPFLQVAIGDLPNRDQVIVNELRQVQLSIQLPSLVTVSAQGLKLNSDQLHLTRDSEVTLGHMLAQAYLDNFLFPAAK